MSRPDQPVARRRGFAASVTLLRDVGLGMVRHFVWGELHEGGLDLRGLDRNARALSWFGLSVLVATIAALIFADSLRCVCDLILLSPDPARGQLAPTLLIPLTLFLLIVAWTFALGGALHAHWAIRWSTVAVYGLHALGWINAVLVADHAHAWQYYAFLGSLLGVIVLFALRGHTKPRPAVEFAALFALVSVVYLVAQQHGVTSLQRFGVPVQIVKMQFNIGYLGGLVTPLMILIGVDIAEFARRAADWSSELVEERLPKHSLTLSVIGLLTWRWTAVVQDSYTAVVQTSLAEQLAIHAGALVELLAIGGVFWSVVRSRRAPTSWSTTELVATALRLAFPLVIFYQAVSLLMFVLLSATLAGSESRFLDSFVQRVWPILQTLNESVQRPWHYTVSLAAGLAAIVALRRGKANVAMYLGMLAVLATWGLLTASDGPLARLQSHSESPSEFWWLAVLSIVAVDRLRRGRFERTQQTSWCFMLLILALFRQRDFIENPFTPLLGFAGTSFIAFGLVWDLATHGAWANHDTPTLPRVSRLFLYLGYVILAAAVLNWAVATHNLDGVQKLTGGSALQGFDQFGKPLLYAIFWLRLCDWQSKELVATDETAEAVRS